MLSDILPTGFECGVLNGWVAPGSTVAIVGAGPIGLAGGRAGGTIANIGVHGKKVDLHLEKLWDRNIAITTRLVDTVTIPSLRPDLSTRRAVLGL